MKNKYQSQDLTSAALRLTESEELVLLAIVSLNDLAYGISIQHRLQESGRKVALGALYATLQRLQTKQAIVVSQRSRPTATRGGRSKTYYVLTRVGEDALAGADQVRSRLRAASPGDDCTPFATSAISSPSEKKSSVEENSVAVPARPLSPRHTEEPQPPPPRPDYLPYYGS